MLDDSESPKSVKLGKAPAAEAGFGLVLAPPLLLLLGCLLRDCRQDEDDDDDDVDKAATAPEAVTALEEGLPRGGGAADLKRSEIHILVKWT